MRDESDNTEKQSGEEITEEGRVRVLVEREKERKAGVFKAGRRRQRLSGNPSFGMRKLDQTGRQAKKRQPARREREKKRIIR